MPRIVATSDSHFPFDISMIPVGDVLIHAGDLMYSGLPNEWQPLVSNLRSLSWFDRKILVPGNHDYHIQNYAGLASSELRKAGVHVLTDYRPTAELDGVKYLGVPFVTGLPGWAFNMEEDWIYDWLMNVTEDFKPDVVISHAPMYGVLDDVHADHVTPTKPLHVGGLALNRWFYGLEQKPKVWIHGHIHESYGITVVEGCEFHNVAMCNRRYEQVNMPHVIELELNNS